MFTVSIAQKRQTTKQCQMRRVGKWKAGSYKPAAKADDYVDFQNVNTISAPTKTLFSIMWDVS